MSLARWCGKSTPSETTLHRNARRSSVEMETREERFESPSAARKTVVGSGMVEIRRDEAQAVWQVVHEYNCYRRSESIAHFEDEEEEAQPEELRLEM